MKRKPGSFLTVVPVFYALIILFFLFHHFSRFEEISLVIDNVSFKGTKTMATAFAPAKISKMAVFTNGLKLNISSSEPMKVITEDDIIRELALESLERTDTGIVLHFKYDISIAIQNMSQSSDSSINIAVPQTIPPIKELRIKALPQESYLLNRDDQDRIILSDGTSTYFMNSSGILDFKDSTLIISMADRVSNTITLEDEAPGLGRSVREWLAEGQKTIPSEKETITRFSDKSYSGWKSRFDKTTGNWTMPAGAPMFSEKALVLSLSESYRRGEQTLLSADLLKAAEKNSSVLSWYSSPFTGDIVNKTAPLLRSSYSSLLQGKTSLKVTANPDISPYREILELKKILDDPGISDPVPWIEENIYPLIVWLEEGLYILHPDQPESNTLFTLEAAELLKMAADRTGDKNIRSISSMIRATILSRADENGVLPEKIKFSRERASLGEGALPPEDVYSLFQDAAFTPRVINMSNDPQKEVWIYTASRSISSQLTDQFMDVKVRFPRGQIHHLIIKGVEPFDRVFLHNIRWKSDPRFQRYSDGWVYDAVNKTLFVKLKHRVEEETIRIQFNPPVEEIPLTESPETAANTPTTAISGESITQAGTTETTE
ncbi:hypothetical protein EXM22_14435 [Oceanispirochaeta crateris]|uniref:Uncharacterized protein n=1 Tax=Oceanispirochaeta crateris TaxID=2518645 RepID=A0A5C1QP43_9SPIO|nr:hypothetical protein [Oceanispirochaeta crateris]QEN09118.1 hypothetical protein EXM22_14435 [Oceanispirochaeta crateris]